MIEQFKKLEEHARQIAQRENCLLYDLEITGQGAGRTLRIFIDKEGEENVSVDDCSRVSQGLNLVLDVEDLVPGGPYNLEISSPGLERRLRHPWHFKAALNSKIHINLNKALGDIVEGRQGADQKRKKLTGILMQVDDDVAQVQMENSEEVVAIPFDSIHKAKIVYEFENNFSKNKKVKKG